MTIAARRKREKQERREAILDAAEQVFFRKGVQGATMDEIASAAELSKGTLYLYFKSRDDLFVSVASRSLGPLVEEFELIAARKLSGIDAIRGLMQAYARNAINNSEQFRTAMMWITSGEKIDIDTDAFIAHQGLVGRIVTAYSSVIERGKNDGTIRPDVDALQASSQIWGGLIGNLLLRVNCDEMVRRFPMPVDFEALVDGFIDVMCSGLEKR
jgi:AcrR family transcriptional regulator